jgi:diamine N-acetyltransferase
MEKGLGEMENQELSLVEVTKENFDEVCKLSLTLTPNQRKCVADNSISISEAHLYTNTWYRAIVLDNVAIGFVMVIKDFQAKTVEDNPSLVLWRFMIGEPWQNKGYGKQVLDILIDQYRREGIRTIYTSCHREENGPYGFYKNYGFVDMEYMVEGEEVLKLVL